LPALWHRQSAPPSHASASAYRHVLAHRRLAIEQRLDLIARQRLVLEQTLGDGVKLSSMFARIFLAVS
jgi:hypothetical protein